jgi:hypothetical protein
MLGPCRVHITLDLSPSASLLPHDSQRAALGGSGALDDVMPASGPCPAEIAQAMGEVTGQSGGE